jgi:hypothetical protein
VEWVASPGTGSQPVGLPGQSGFTRSCQQRWVYEPPRPRSAEPGSKLEATTTKRALRPNPGGGLPVMGWLGLDDRRRSDGRTIPPCGAGRPMPVGPQGDLLPQHSAPAVVSQPSHFVRLAGLRVRASRQAAHGFLRLVNHRRGVTVATGAASRPIPPCEYGKAPPPGSWRGLRSGVAGPAFRLGVSRASTRGPSGRRH